MAFDKCTLLSSQGSDAPAARPLSLARRATSLSYSSSSACQIDVLAARRPQKLSVTASHEERSGALRSGSSAGPQGNFSILSHSLDRVKSAVRDCFSVSGQHFLDGVRGVGTSIIDPKVVRTQRVALHMGGGSPLEGGKALGLSASLWGEQVISYVACGNRANPGRTPGVSRANPLIFRGFTSLPSGSLRALSG